MDVPDFLRNGPVLIALFAVLAFGASAGTILALGGSTSDLMYGLAGGVAIAVAVIGAYVVGRKYGQPHSHAVAQSGIVFGVALLITIVADLLIAAGELSRSEIALGLGGFTVAVAALILLISLFDRAVSPG